MNIDKMFIMMNNNYEHNVIKQVNKHIKHINDHYTENKHYNKT